jgi:cobalt-precorrin-5B (C1)-methyltransferase
VTDGVIVYAKINLTDGGIVIDGGRGIGRVTKPGLACPVDEAAINPVPRKMIEEQLRRAAADFDYEGGFAVEISIPAGIALAQKTFNPRLGIVGGISVLGTSGIVEPMSEQALIDTIRLQINMRRASGEKALILTPGNYGEAFLAEQMGLEKGMAVKCSNFIGESLAHCRENGGLPVLLVGHLGKLIKVAAGVLNTHSKYGDGRMEILSGYLRQVGIDRERIQQIEGCVTTEEAVGILRSEVGKDEKEQQVMTLILNDIQQQIKQKLRGTAEVILYTNTHGMIGKTAGADNLIKKVKTGE